MATSPDQSNQPEKTETPATPQEAPKPNAKPISKPIHSLKSTMKLTDIDKPKEVESGQVEEEVEKRVAGRDPFTLDQVKTHWKTYHKKLTDANRVTESLVMKNRDLILDDKTIRIEVDNHVQLEKLSDFKEDLMFFLRSSINNGELQLEAKITEKRKENLVYTSQEKFAYLQKKHPLLEKFKDDFGLEAGF